MIVVVTWGEGGSETRYPPTKLSFQLIFFNKRTRAVNLEGDYSESADSADFDLTSSADNAHGEEERVAMLFATFLSTTFDCKLALFVPQKRCSM